MRGREGGSQAEVTDLPNLRGHTGKDGGGHDGFIVAAQETAATLTKGGHSEGVSFPGRRKEDDENLVVAFQQTPQGDLMEGEDVTPPVLGRGGSVGNNTPMVATGFIPGTGAKARSMGIEEEVSPTLKSVDSGNTRTPAVFTKTHGAQSTDDHELWDEATEARTLNGMAYATDVVVDAPTTLYPTENRNAGQTWSDESPTLKVGTKLGDAAAAASAPAVQQHPGAAVRRLTPRECERLQGFPDDWTLIEPDTADGPRYAAIGDAVTVNVPFWIVSRLRRKLARA